MRHQLSLTSIGIAGFLVFPLTSLALNPDKTITQYTKTAWTQTQGLPGDTVFAIAQTPDGYLWVGTNDGLARFDGYEFTVFGTDHNVLPSNTIVSLAAGAANELWIGTPNGLSHYKNGLFRTLTVSDGLPDNSITSVAYSGNGSVWIISGSYVCELRSGRVQKVWAPNTDIPLNGVSTIGVDRQDHLWISGYGGVAQLSSGLWTAAAKTDDPTDFAVGSVIRDHAGNLWMGSYALRMLTPDGTVIKYALPSGLGAIRCLREDQDGNIWVGTTTGGLLRFRAGHFNHFSEHTQEADVVYCIYEDRDGDLWVGMGSGLYRFRDDTVVVYSKAEGLPSDAPTTVYQDRRGNLWVGFRDIGVVRFDKDHFRADMPNGVPRTQVFSIRESPNGDILISSLDGLTRLHDGRSTTYVPDYHFGRKFVFDAVEDRDGRQWIAYGGGLSELIPGGAINIIPGGLVRSQFMRVLYAGSGSILWAGTAGNGLWRVAHGKLTHFTTADGLTSNQIRCITQGRDGTLWIGTWGGGLNSFRDGHFNHFTSAQGLLSDNIFYIQDDEMGSLWVSTNRGISRIPRQQLADIASRKRSALTPTNYTEEDGIQGITGQSAFTADGRFWTPMRNGLAVLDPSAKVRVLNAPLVHVIAVRAGGKIIDSVYAGQFSVGVKTVEIRYAAISIRAPERIRYSYKLEGFDTDWISAGTQRTAAYNNLTPGHYTFILKATLKNAPTADATYTFDILPYWYDTWWFRCTAILTLIACMLLGYRMHLQQIRDRFALVLEERTRLARELHDTLAQDFVGISSQLDALSISMKFDQDSAHNHLKLAMRMVRHSLTEARRAIMDLRTSAVYDHHFVTALKSEADRWALGAPVRVELDIPNHIIDLPAEFEQNLLRIAQEAVTNAIKHASAASVRIRIDIEGERLSLSVADNGRGFAKPDLFSSTGGHFGLVGMRERAERMGGTFKLETGPEQGTIVEVLVPLDRL